ncbi:hypothetical protein VPH35_067292 [Triticum aestivum]
MTLDALCIFPMITSMFVMLPFEVCVQFFLSKCMFVLGLQNLRCHLLHPSTIFPAEPAGSTQERQVQMRVRGASSIDRRSFFVRKGAACYSSPSPSLLAEERHGHHHT